MGKYIMRLDDACNKMDIEKWNRIEALLDKYNVKPLVGIIPHCEDSMMDIYQEDKNFWKKVEMWQKKEWTIALHGYNHVYSTRCGGINPVNPRSEFAGNPYEVQAEKIRNGVSVFRAHGIDPLVFFAPSHTFDTNTLRALKEESNIRIISDTWAWNVYTKDGFTFVPQQSGLVRLLPFALSTFCYHPNIMSNDAFEHLEDFLKNHHTKFASFPECHTSRKLSWIDRMLQNMYFMTRKFK